jgi:DNA helicase-2/ATP-dependent DNA helicase PcrA
LGLGLSYRSSPRVLELLNTVSSALSGQPLAPHAPDDWHGGGVTTGMTFDTGVQEAKFIERISSLILEKRPAATIGIICRSGWRRKPIDSVFAKSDTPSTRWDLAVDNPRTMELIRDAVLRLGGTPAAGALKNEVLARVDDSDVDTAADAVDAIEQLEALAEEVGSISGALEQLRVLEEGDAAIGPGVHLLNAHTGKGQQFDWVFIPGFEKGNIPSFLAKSKPAIEEEHRVLLVMLSRARHGVIVTRAKSLISKRGNSYDTQLSPWAAEIRPGLAVDRAGLEAHIAALPDLDSEEVVSSRTTQA